MISERKTPDLPTWLRELYPFSTRSLRIGEHRMSFVDEGPREARAIVLLHGNPAWSLVFRDVIQRLASDHRVVAPDLIGFGLSSKPCDAGYHTIKRHAANVSALVDAMALESVTLVLHGASGPVGLSWAAANRDRLARIVLVNSWGAVVPNAKWNRLPLLARLAARQLAWLLDGSLIGLSSFLDACEPAEKAREGYLFPFKHETAVAVKALQRFLFDPDPETRTALVALEAELKNVNAPTEIVHGLRDPFVGRLAAYLLRDSIKSAREPIFVDDAGHFLPERAPRVVHERIIPTRMAQTAAPQGLFKILT